MMSALRKSLVIAAATVLLGACGDRGSDKVNTPDDDVTRIPPQNLGEIDVNGQPKAQEPRILDFSQFESKDFSSFSWEQKCDGIGHFMREFAAAYLDSGITIVQSPDDCMLAGVDTQAIYFSPRFDIKKGDVKLSLTVRIVASFNQEKYQLLVYQADIVRQVNDMSSTSFRVSKDDYVFGENLRNLEKTLVSWAKQEPIRMTTVFEIPYVDFVKSAEKKFGPESTGLKIETIRPMTFQLIPDENAVGTGTVNFISVDRTAFFYVDKDGNEVSKPFMRCSDLNCLNESPIKYRFLGNSILLSSPTIKQGGVTSTEVFKISLSSWE
jgi:hypothetical protein